MSVLLYLLMGSRIKLKWSGSPIPGEPSQDPIIGNFRRDSEFWFSHVLRYVQFKERTIEVVMIQHT